MFDEYVDIVSDKESYCFVHRNLRPICCSNVSCSLMNNSAPIDWNARTSYEEIFLNVFESKTFLILTSIHKQGQKRKFNLFCVLTVLKTIFWMKKKTLYKIRSFLSFLFLNFFSSRIMPPFLSFLIFRAENYTLLCPCCPPGWKYIFFKG